MEEDPQPYQIEYIKTLQFSANNLMSIVNDILDFSKIEAGKITFERIPFNLRELLADVARANRIKAHDKRIKLILTHDVDIPEMVIGDPVRLSQILNNLIGNAIKFTHIGEVVINTQFEGWNDQQSCIRFSIKDTGIGIPEEKHSQLFEEFSQVDASITRKFGGTGLGLAITKRLLELQGSSINLVSAPGQGSEFSFLMRFVIPQADGLEVNTQTRPFQKFNSLHGASILLVEDNDVNVLVAKKIMRNWDVHITHAANGREAVNLVIQQAFDIVLMDLQMPVMDGYEAATTIRKAGFSPEKLPVIALTASAMLSEKNQALEAGMNDLVTKPFNPTELYMKLKKYLDRKMN
jgi:CheY-like chemotaxis protein